MQIIRQIYFRLAKLNKSIQRRRYRATAKWTAAMHGSVLEWPVSAVAVVPIRCDGRGTVLIGERVRLGYRAATRLGNGEILLQARSKNSSIRIGADCSMNNNFSIISLLAVEIGERVMIGDGVSIFDSDFHRVDPTTRWDGSDDPEPVSIGRNVWLGSRVLILKGVTIGENTVVAAGSVVTKSLPPNVVAGGVPAKVLRHLN